MNGLLVCRSETFFRWLFIWMMTNGMEILTMMKEKSYDWILTMMVSMMCCIERLRTIGGIIKFASATERFLIFLQGIEDSQIGINSSLQIWHVSMCSISSSSLSSSNVRSIKEGIIFSTSLQVMIFTKKSNANKAITTGLHQYGTAFPI